MGNIQSKTCMVSAAVAVLVGNTKAADSPDFCTGFFGEGAYTGLSQQIFGQCLVDAAIALPLPAITPLVLMNVGNDEVLKGLIDALNAAINASPASSGIVMADAFNNVNSVMPLDAGALDAKIGIDTVCIGAKGKACFTAQVAGLDSLYSEYNSMYHILNTICPEIKEITELATTNEAFNEAVDTGNFGDSTMSPAEFYDRFCVLQKSILQRVVQVNFPYYAASCLREVHNRASCTLHSLTQAYFPSVTHFVAVFDSIDESTPYVWNGNSEADEHSVFHPFLPYFTKCKAVSAVIGDKEQCDHPVVHAQLEYNNVDGGEEVEDIEDIDLSFQTTKELQQLCAVAQTAYYDHNDATAFIGWLEQIKALVLNTAWHSDIVDQIGEQRIDRSQNLDDLYNAAVNVDQSDVTTRDTHINTLVTTIEALITEVKNSILDPKHSELIIKITQIHALLETYELSHHNYESTTLSYDGGITSPLPIGVSQTCETVQSCDVSVPDFPIHSDGEEDTPYVANGDHCRGWLFTDVTLHEGSSTAIELSEMMYCGDCQSNQNVWTLFAEAAN